MELLVEIIAYAFQLLLELALQSPPAPGPVMATRASAREAP
jgi:hypothetical protein